MSEFAYESVSDTSTTLTEESRGDNSTTNVETRYTKKGELKKHPFYPKYILLKMRGI
jgi:hypothetical protein